MENIRFHPGGARGGNYKIRVCAKGVEKATCLRLVARSKVGREDELVRVGVPARVGDQNVATDLQKFCGGVIAYTDHPLDCRTGIG